MNFWGVFFLILIILASIVMLWGTSDWLVEKCNIMNFERNAIVLSIMLIVWLSLTFLSAYLMEWR